MDGYDESLQQLQVSLGGVQEDRIVGALRSALDLLCSECSKAQEAPEGGGRLNADSKSCGAAVHFRVRCCCCALQRAAALIACSDFLLPEVITALQEKLHAQPEVSGALLHTHLDVLTSQPCVFELILRSFPPDPLRLSRFYKRLLETLNPDTSLLAPTGMLAAHVRRELQRLMPARTAGSTSRSDLEAQPAAITLSLHLPMLVELALQAGSNDREPNGWADTLNSCVSESTEIMTSNLGNSAADAGQPPRRAPRSLATDGIGLKAAAAVYQMLLSPQGLLPQLGLGTKARLGSAKTRTDCLAELLGLSATAADASVTPDQSLVVALQLIEVLLTTASRTPQLANAIFTLAEEQPKAGAEVQQQSLIPVSAASNGGTRKDHTTSGNLRVASARASAAKSSDALPAAAQTRLDQISADLLSLHAALTQLQGKQSGCNTGQLKDQKGLLETPTLLWLAKLVLRQLQQAAYPAAKARRNTPRSRSTPMANAKDCPAYIAPEVAAHLLQLIRQRLLAEKAACSTASSIEPSEEARDCDHAMRIAEIALLFSSAAFKGPQPEVAYESRMPTAQAVKRELMHPTLQHNEGSKSASAEDQQGSHSEGRAAKRAKSSAQPASPPLQATASLAGAASALAMHSPNQPASNGQTLAKSLKPSRQAGLPGRLSRFRPPDPGKHAPCATPPDAHNISLKHARHQALTPATATATATPSNSTQKKSVLGTTAAPLPSVPATPRPAVREVSRDREDSAPRRIAPTPVTEEEAHSAALTAGIPDQLLRQKDEYEAYWEHYISVKEELVEKVLQDDMDGEETNLLGLVPSESPQKGGRGPTGNSSRVQLLASVNLNPAFREPEWQCLHAAALALLTHCLHEMVPLAATGSLDSSSRIWQVLRQEGVWHDVKQMALLGSRIVDPSITHGSRYESARQGAQAFPNECLVLGVATRFAQYCIGPGAAVSPTLTACFLQLLSWLVDLCTKELLLKGEPKGLPKMTRPLKLVSGVLMAALERGCLRSVPFEAAEMAAFIRCTLPAMEPDEGVLLIAAALWTALQNRKTVDAFQRCPSWLRGCSSGWLALWMHLPSVQHARAACAELLSQCPDLLHVLLHASEEGLTRLPGNHADCRLEAQTALASAVRTFCQATLHDGKEIATGAALREALLTAAILLKSAAVACDVLLAKLAASKTAAQQALPRALEVSLAGSGQSVQARASAHSGASKVDLDDARGSVWQLAAAAASGAPLAAACQELLTWRRQTCPSRAKEPAAALDAVLTVFEARWKLLMEARHAGNALAGDLACDCLDEAEDSIGRVLAGDDSAAGLLLQQPSLASSKQPNGDSASCSESDNEASRGPRGRWRPRNAYLRAAVAEDKCVCPDSEEDSGYSDLEDFIVCKPGRDYKALIAKEFKYRSLNADRQR